MMENLKMEISQGLEYKHGPQKIKQKIDMKETGKITICMEWVCTIMWMEEHMKEIGRME